MWGRKLWTARRVRREGRRHGRNWRWRLFPFRKEEKAPEPPAGQRGPAQFEMQLREAAEVTLTDLERSWRQQDERLRAAWLEARREYEDAKRSLEREAAEAERAAAEHERARQEVDALGVPTISATARNLWLLAFAIFEFPLNATVFQVFELTPWETRLVAASVGIMIPALAHLTGRSLRQAARRPVDTFLLWLGVAGALGVIGSIAYARSKYLGSEAALGLLGISLDPATLTVVFILINLGIFVTAMIVSYEGTHPQAARYRQARLRLAEATHRLRKESGEAQAARRRFEGAGRALDRAKARREGRFARFQAEANAVIAMYEALVRSYRVANISARPAGTTPPCFDEEPRPVGLPGALERLDWPTGSPGGGP